ncbi:unnamed protein product [Auanema sp. JU1783]|nr:unnamed protein product [Auanema sp. JU1783]
MRENMQKIWQWISDRKTNTIRKWRSSLIRLRQDSQDNSIDDARRNGKIVISSSAGNLRQPRPEYEDFFEEPNLKQVLEVRRQSFRDRTSDCYPVPAPDLDDNTPNPYLDKITTSTPKATPRGIRKNPNRQIRFQIPEVHVSFEAESPQRIIFSDERRSPVPPPEIEWTNVLATTTPNTSPSETLTTTLAVTTLTTTTTASGSMSSVAENKRAPILKDQPYSISFDMSSTGETMPPSTPRRNSASEKARQNLMAQRRQSNVQLVNQITGRRTSTTIIPLTQAQIHLVRSLWRQVFTTKGPTVIGQSIYHRLCFKSPVVKEQIRRVPLPPKFQNHDSFIKAHSKAMAELIDQVVENLYNLEVMTDELMRIGKVHARLLRGELTGKLWNIVAETFIDCTLEWGDKRCRSETVRKAWALIVAFVVEKIKLGHHEQRKLMLATRQSLPSIDVPMAALKF